jgi:hypothetical protein
MKIIFISSTPNFATVTNCRCGAKLPAVVITDADVHCHSCVEKRRS